MIKKLLLVFTFYFFFKTVSYSQGYAGRDFWFTFLENTPYCPLAWGDTLVLFLSSPYAATVTIEAEKEYPYETGSDTAFYTTVNLKPNQTFAYQLPGKLSVHSLYTDFVTNDGIHVYADSQITVTAVNSSWRSKGGTNILPVEAIPYSPEYVLTTNDDPTVFPCYKMFGYAPSKSPQFGIVGIAERSVIEIVPVYKSNVKNNKSGIPIVIVLYKGKTFGYTSIGNDLTGTIIRSRDANSKFAVFNGTRQTYSSQLNSSGVLCSSSIVTDHTYEQAFPTVTWGSSYTALPFKNNSAGYFLKIVAYEDFTRISINGNYYKTLNQGQFITYNVSKDTATRISGDKKIEVAQFTLSTGCNLHPAPKTNMGDVSQLQLIPDRQSITSTTINKIFKSVGWGWKNPSSLNEPESYINVLLKTADTSAFRINGKAVPVNNWKGGNTLTGYSYAQLTIDTILYRLTSAKGFIAYTYGYGVNTGYALAAAGNFKIVNNNFYIDNQCIYDSTRFYAMKNDSFKNYSWSAGNNTGIMNGAKATTWYKDTGWYKVVMYTRHVRTNALDSVVKKIYIDVAKNRGAVLINDTIICGKVEFNLYSKNFNSDYDYYWQDGHQNYYYQVSNPGLYWEKVTERNGCYYTDTLIVTQYPNPYSSFSLSDTLFCANRSKSITFTNLSTSIDTIAQMQWDFGDQNINDTHHIVKHIYKKADLYYVSLKITTVHGCYDDTFQLVQVLKSPDAEFTLIKVDSCLNSNHVIFTNTTVIDSAVHQRFKWHFSDSFVISNGNPQGPRTFTMAGKQYAELIYENFNGCIDTMKKDIMIYAPAKATFSFKNNFSCTNDSIRIINKTTSLYKPVKNSWDFGDNTKNDTAFSPAHFYKKKGSYKVTLITQIPQGCRDTGSHSVTVYGAPKADFKINDDIQCLIDNRFSFVNTSTVDTGGFPIRQWFYSDGTGEQNSDSVVKTFVTSGNKSIKLKVSGIFGCVDSVVKTVYVKSAPDARFTINDNSQCMKVQDFVFTYPNNPANDSISRIIWYYYTDSIKQVNPLKKIKFPFIGSYTVKLKLESQYGCDGESLQTVFVNPNPVARFKVPKSLQCLSGNVFTPVHNSTVSKGDVTGFDWDFGDQTGSNKEFPQKTYSGSGSYKIILTAFTDSGCTDTTSSVVKVRSSAAITLVPVKESCLNDTITLDGIAIVTDGFIRKYQWDYGDNAISDTVAVAQTRHVYKQVGQYNVKLTTISNYNCVDSKTENNWVMVNGLPNAAFGYDIKDGGQHNSVITFTDLTQPKSLSLRWDFGPYGTSRKSDTSVSIVDTTTIRARLYVTDSKGCTGMIEKDIFLAPPGEMYFPTAFTANGDGLNDVFGPQGIAFATNYKFTIYNRWGEMVYKSTKLGETWDGSYEEKRCQNGFYVYKLELNDFYGKYKSYEGTVLLVW